MANTRVEAQIISAIEAEWRSKPDTYRPFGVWIRRYAPLPAEADQVDYYAMPEAVWFLDNEGLRPENVWKWVRFVTMQSFVGSQLDIGRRTHPIGLAAFAFYEDGEGCYSETQWGLRWGVGWYWTVVDGSLSGRDRLWVS